MYENNAKNQIFKNLKGNVCKQFFDDVSETYRTFYLSQLYKESNKNS